MAGQRYQRGLLAVGAVVLTALAVQLPAVASSPIDGTSDPAGNAAARPAVPGDWGLQETVISSTAVSRAPSLGGADDGTAWVVWEEGAELAASRRNPAAAGWSAPEPVAVGYGPDVAVDDAGTPHVVFANDVEGQIDIFYTYRAGDRWALPRNVSGTLGLSSTPALAVAGGTRYVAWSDAERLYLGRSTHGDQWSVAPVLINGRTVRGMQPRLTATAAGVVDLVWQTPPADGPTTVRHALLAGGRWSLPEEVPLDRPAADPDLAPLPEGRRGVAWRGSDGRMMLAVGTTGLWGEPEEATVGGGARGWPAIAGRAPGVDIAWRAVTGGVLYRLRTGPEAWQPIDAVTANDAAELTMSPAGAQLWVAWSVERTSAWEIRARVKQQDTIVRTPTPSPTRTATPQVTATATPSATPTRTSTPAASATPTGLVPPSATASGPTPTADGTPSATATPGDPMRTATPAETAELSPTPGPSPTTDGTPRATASPGGPTRTATATSGTPGGPPPSTAVPTEGPSPGGVIYLPWASQQRAATSAADSRPARLDLAATASVSVVSVSAADWAAARSVRRVRGDGCRPSAAERIPRRYGHHPSAAERGQRRDGHRASAAGRAARPVRHPRADRVRASRSRRGRQPSGDRRWSEPAVISVRAERVWAPDAAVDPDGALRVAWEEAGQVWAARGDAEGWGTPVRVAAGETPSLALAPDGTLHLLFANTFGGQRDIFHVTQLPGGRWSLPVNVSRTASYSTAPVLRSGGPNRPLLAAWSEIKPSGPRVYQAGWDGHRWHYAPLLQARGLGADLAPSADGLALAWHGRPAPNRPYAVYLATRHDARWSLPERVSNGAAEATLPALRAHGQMLHVTWREHRPDGVRYSRRASAGWGPVEALGDGADAGPLLMASGPGGRQVLWARARRAYDALGLGRRAWRRADELPVAAEADQLAAVVGPDGALHVVWTVRADDGAQVLAARREPCRGCRALAPMVARQ